MAQKNSGSSADSALWMLGVILKKNPGLLLYPKLDKRTLDTLKMELGFLRTFTRFTARRNDIMKIDCFRSLVVNAEAAARQAKDKIYSANKKGSCFEAARDLRYVLHALQGKIEPLKPQMIQVYDHYLSNLSNPPSQSDQLLWDNLFESLRHNLIYLSRKFSKNNTLQGLNKRIDALKGTLRLLTNFVTAIKPYLHPPQDYKDIWANLQDLAVCTAHLSCLCWLNLADDQLDDTTMQELIVKLSGLQRKMQPHHDPEAMEMYLSFLKHKFFSYSDRKSAELLVRHFVHLLLGTSTVNTTRDQDGGAKVTLSLLEEELVFLVIFITSTPSSKHLEEDLGLISKDIKQVARDVASQLQMSQGAILLQGNPLLFKLISKVELLKAEAILIKLQFTGLPKDQTEELLREFRFPEKFPWNSQDECTESSEVILAHIEAVDMEARSVYRSFHANKITESMARHAFLKLFLRIKLLKAEMFSMELLKRGPGSNLPVKDLIDTLQEGLKFLKETVRKQSEETAEDKSMILTRIDILAKGVMSFYHSFHAAEVSEDVIRDMKLSLSGLLNKIKLVKAELDEINSQAPRIYFPKTNGLGFVDFLLRNIRELTKYKANRIASVKPEIDALMGDLEILRSLLKDISDKSIEDQELKDLGETFIYLAYEAEYVIDSIVARGTAEGHHLSRFHYVIDEIRIIKLQVTKIYEEKSYDAVCPSAAQNSSRPVAQAKTPTVDGIMVDLNDQEEVILGRLTRGSSGRDIVSLVGMPGIGKTTLAKKVYTSPMVSYHFHIRAWCRVSQVYKKRELLLDILGDIISLTDNILEESDEDLELRLYQQLKNRKYLIVMDDLWSSRALDDLGQSFPNDDKGSRILVTTRLHDVALKSRSNSDPHLLRPLTGDESWTLLQKKLLHSEGFPEELLEVGKKIAQNCKGLPLAVVAIAGLLKRTDKKHERWQQIAESLSSSIVDDPETRCKDILELSYKHLPDCLKPCFLYLGAFLEDKDIPVGKLIRLWIAEGLIPESTGERLEDLAEEYLRDMIQRNLVMMAGKRSIGGAKACRVHNLLRDLCLVRCKEENFLQLITGFDDLFASDSDGLDYGTDPDYSYPSNFRTYKEYRLFISCKRKHFVMSRPSGRRVRSLLFSAARDMYPRCPYDVSFILENFPLLRVLDLECINLGNSFPYEIAALVQLRYLAICGDIDSIPSSIANLWNLVTLLVKGLKGKVVLPDSIWTMRRLRHIHVNDQAAFSLQDVKLLNSSQLHNLVSLSTPTLSSGENTKKIMQRLPKLRKLRCIFSDSRVDSQNSNKFPVLDFLTELESLKIFFYGRISHPGQFGFPLNLKKLALSNFRLPWNCIAEIGRLPNLKVLKLLSKAFEGKIWDMRELEFKELEFLKLDSISFTKWIASSDNLPKLQKLVLRNCKQLEEVPSGFADIQTLQMIELQLCRHSAEESVKRLKEEQVDMGNEELKVLINLSNWEFGSSY